MQIKIEDYEEFNSQLNVFENEKEVKDFCQISDNIEDLQAFRNTCFESGGSNFVHLIDERINEIIRLSNF